MVVVEVLTNNNLLAARALYHKSFFETYSSSTMPLVLGCFSKRVSSFANFSFYVCDSLAISSRGALHMSVNSVLNISCCSSFMILIWVVGAVWGCEQVQVVGGVFVPLFFFWTWDRVRIWLGVTDFCIHPVYWVLTYPPVLLLAGLRDFNRIFKAMLL